MRSDALTVDLTDIADVEAGDAGHIYGVCQPGGDASGIWIDASDLGELTSNTLADIVEGDTTFAADK